MVTTRSQAAKAARTNPHPRGATPNPHGSSIIQKLEPETEHPIKPSISKYEHYIAQDFKRHRVFVDIEVFMKHVLHVPDNWMKVWGRTIQEIKRNGAFSDALYEYNAQCEAKGAPESKFYGPLVDMVDAVFEISAEALSHGNSKPKSHIRCLRNDPKKILGGVLSELVPDIVTVHGEFFNRLPSEEQGERCLKETNLTWAHPLQMLEVKHVGRLLIDGSWMPRLKVNGIDPRERHAKPYEKPKEQTSTVSDKVDDGPASVPSLPLKRPVAEPFIPDRKSQKVFPQSIPGRAGGQDGDDVTEDPGKETKGQKETYLQVGRYLLEQFSVPAFRSHATIGLVDRDRIQFYHANHSVILVSSAISFSPRHPASEIEKFIAIVLAFSRLSLRDSGILHDIRGGRLFMDNRKLPTSKVPCKALKMQGGNRLELRKGKRRLKLKLGDLISHEPSLVGRGTAVLHATSSENANLIVKISWPGSGRVPEDKFLEKAIKKAKSSEDHKWALMHLPNLVFSESVDFGPGSTHGKVASLFHRPEFVNGEYEYERRTLRIIVQERLYPLKTLTDVKEIAQVLLDIACIHRWLYEVVGILHRDLSPNNIMYRRTEKGEVYGVLTDFDLSSFTAHLGSDYTKTSQQRTGTPPYMAYGLLRGSDTFHLYRHDVESLFYIILILTTRYEIRASKKGEEGGLQKRQGLDTLPYDLWFNQPSYVALASFKQNFLMTSSNLDLSPEFEDFSGWLEDLRRSFRKGVRSEDDHAEALRDWRKRQIGAAPQFDAETMGEHVGYSTLINPTRNLTGKLEGLTIRYDAGSSTSTEVHA